MSDQELNAKVRAMEEQRQASDNKQFRPRTWQGQSQDTAITPSTPCLKLDPNDNAAANDFVKEGRRVQEESSVYTSCYSGIIAQELNDFKDSTLLGENTVTIQAACGDDERALGGYFTPCFVYLNDPKNVNQLNQLETDWQKMTEGMRIEYRSIDLPSPMVVTTRSQSQGATMELAVQNFKLTLFQDPGFFKFCFYQGLPTPGYMYEGSGRI
ncbi:hypothetical protein OS493_000853 [Desmophyllum pertusum]|uniref:Uncharacterized protein n=1 Tax=Desmophyllum pertusum TaxID=174260 RepID=A0A9X0D4Y7_9CNID|nr:hypothetical protein OS493_000853 [Desmophyllum pertusum]